MNKFKVGDFVKRHSDVYDDTSKWLTGIVIKVYTAHSKYGSYPELYEVEWTSINKIERGFLPHGLDYNA